MVEAPRLSNVVAAQEDDAFGWHTDLSEDNLR